MEACCDQPRSLLPNQGRLKAAPKRLLPSRRPSPAAPAPAAAPAPTPSTAATPGLKTALNPTAAWPFPTGSRPEVIGGRCGAGA